MECDGVVHRLFVVPPSAKTPLIFSDKATFEDGELP